MTSICEEDIADAQHETAPRNGPPSLEAVLEPANVSAAWQRVRRNRGCAGVDGVSIVELEPLFDQEWLLVERAVRSETYQPQPLLRVRIPKPSGGERLLGIPTVLDRVVPAGPGANPRARMGAEVLAPQFRLSAWARSKGCVKRR